MKPRTAHMLLKLIVAVAGLTTLCVSRAIVMSWDAMAYFHHCLGLGAFPTHRSSSILPDPCLFSTLHSTW